MARHPRLIYPGIAAHVIQRGNNRNACFRHEVDYLVYLAHLRQLAGKHRCALHAYCLMTNHVHLLLTPDSEDACSEFMHDLGTSYVRYFNRRHGRSGTLWEGRFRSCIVESARYVLACHRYIELNPVRARMVSHPASYAWSSHRANSGVQADPSLTAHPEFEALTREAYGSLCVQPFEEEILKSIRDATNGGYPLASDDFKARLSAESPYRIERNKPGPKPPIKLSK